MTRRPGRCRRAAGWRSRSERVDDVADVPEPVQCGERVGAGVDDAPVTSSRISPSPTGVHRGAARSVRRRRGTRPRRSCARGRRRTADRSAPAGSACGPRRGSCAARPPRSPVATDDGDGLLADGDVVVPLRVAVAAPGASSRPGRAVAAPRSGAACRRGRRRRPSGRCSAGSGRPPASLRHRGRHPQHEVGERQVREHLPVPDEQVQPLDVGGPRSVCALTSSLSVGTASA